jgi:DNA-binding transcriptional ArsR family regulator
VTKEAETSEGQADTRSIEIVSDPVRIRTMLDETRSEILKIVKMGIYREGILTYDMSVGEISDRIGSAPQRIYHHVDKLIEHGFLEKSREEKKVRSITTYYKRTAKAFIINYDADNPPKDVANKTEEWVKTMLTGFNIQLHSHEIITLLELISKLWHRSAIIMQSLSTKVSNDISYKDFDQVFGFLNDIMLYNDPEVRETKDAISKILVPKLNKPEIEQKLEMELESELKINY